MNRYKKLLALLTITILILSIFAGCAAPQRKPGQPNNIGDNNQNMTPGGSNGGNAISATFEMVDFSYATVTAGSVNVRAGVGTNFPSIGKISSGQKIRVLGKLDGWYVVKMPDSNKIGCVAKQYLKAYTTTNTTSTPKPLPTTPSGTGTGTSTGTATGSGTMSSDESRILQLCNAERSKAGVSPLKANNDLTKLARMKSQDMVNKNYFSHQSPTYGSPFDMMKNYGISYMYAGENIAMNQTADKAFTAWMNSEGHRKNILNPNFTEIGVGIAGKGGGSNLYTQEFIGR